MSERKTRDKLVDGLADRHPSRAEFDRLRKSHDVLVGALQAIADGEGFYEAQAREYKRIARIALEKVRF